MTPVGWPPAPPEQDVLLAVRLVGAPVPKGRARHGNGRTFTPEQTRSFEAGVALQVRAAMRGRAPILGLVGARIHYVLPDRTADLDNLVKSTLDGASLLKAPRKGAVPMGRAIRNDKQVRQLVVTEQIDKANPHTVLVIYRLPAGETA